MSVTDDFRALAERIVDDLLEADPVTATALGDHRFDDRLPDLSGDGGGVAAAGSSTTTSPRSTPSTTSSST